MSPGPASGCWVLGAGAQLGHTASLARTIQCHWLEVGESATCWRSEVRPPGLAENSLSGGGK